MGVATDGTIIDVETNEGVCISYFAKGVHVLCKAHFIFESGSVYLVKDKSGLIFSNVSAHSKESLYSVANGVTYNARSILSQFNIKFAE